VFFTVLTLDERPGATKVTAKEKKAAKVEKQKEKVSSKPKKVQK
jgi:hypothetical protein